MNALTSPPVQFARPVNYYRLLTYTPPEQRAEAIMADYSRFSLRRWFWGHVFDLTVKIQNWLGDLQWLAYMRADEDIATALEHSEEEIPDDCLTARGLKVRRYLDENWWPT
jgi:hypothetical protein